MDVQPLVSIILPTFNRRAYLEVAIASVLAQTYPHWELIVVDDGSTDGTRAYLAQLREERVRMVERPHCGNPAQLRNDAVALARGAYLAFLDSDDAWRPDKLSTQLNGMRAQEAVRWSYTDYELMDADGQVLDDPPVEPWTAQSGWILERLITFEALVGLPTVMMDADLFDEAGGFDTSLLYCSDYDLWFRLAQRSPVLAIPRKLSAIRSYPDSYTRDRARVYAFWVRTYRKLMAESERDIARLCRRQIARSLANRGRLYVQEGRLVRAVVEYLKACRHDPVWRWR